MSTSVRASSGRPARPA